MRSSTVFSAGGLLLAARLASAQTFTDCNPLEKTCPCEPGLGGTVTTDFTKGKSSDYSTADGTVMTYGSDGAEFTIKKTEAPTMSLNKFIMFGKVSVVMKAAPGPGVVSSLVLESADLDEIDLEWIGSVPNEVQSNFFGKGNTTSYDRGGHHPVADAVNTFHEYAIDWTKDKIDWLVDGNVVRTVNYGDAVALGGKNYPQTPMAIKMGNWVGCADAAAAASDTLKWTCDWAGGPLDLSLAPYVMYVKSVNIKDYGTGGEYCYSDKSGSYQSITMSGKSSDSSSDDSSSAAASSSAPVKAVASSTKGSSTATTSASGSTTTGSSSDSKSSSGTASSDASATTLTSTVSAPEGSATVAAAATTATPAVQSTSNAQTLKPKHKYGFIDLGVIAFGLALGYLVM